MTEPLLEVRSTARLVFLDEEGKVLFFRHTDGQRFMLWDTPGGGIEPSESVEAAVQREAAEELGLTSVRLRRHWSGHPRFMFANRRVSQAATFFLIELHLGEIGAGCEDVHRREGILEILWWSVEEVKRATEVVFRRIWS